MAAEVEPAELAQLLDLAERPRVENWSLRAALTRYAQPQPQRGSAVIELVRRCEAALHPHAKVLAKRGHELWASVAADGDAGAGSGPASGTDDARIVGVLRAMQALDRLADVLAGWAVARSDPRPDDDVDRTVAAVTARLEALGVEREERPPPPRGGRRG